MLGDGPDRLNRTGIKRGARCTASVDYNFVGEQEGSRTIRELDQVHSPVEIVHLAQNSRLFAEPAAPVVVTHRPKQPAPPPHPIDVRSIHHARFPSTGAQRLHRPATTQDYSKLRAVDLDVPYALKFQPMASRPELDFELR
jgi:hypothetical protein